MQSTHWKERPNWLCGIVLGIVQLIVLMLTH
jgi:hypothetical protein